MNIRAILRSRFTFLSVGLVLVMALTACGSSTSSSSSTAASTTSSAGVTTAPATAASDYGDSSATSATPAASPAASAATPAAGATTVMVATDAKLGAILTNADGMTLYTYEKDTPGKSVCNGACATNWPPVSASGTPTAPSGATGTFGTITRDDGTSQLTYNGMPLYTYIKDKAPGDTTGQDVGDVWYVALAAATSGTPTAEKTTILVATDAKLGKILTNSDGMTLYIYTKDTPGKSVCNGECAVNWPPLSASDAPTAPDGVTGKLGTITRDDGSTQVTYNDQPLYTFIGDTKSGDTTGQDVGGVWFIVNP
jgi:predicted lipoprotein with Yx(FWY)xxD motif